jgi:hypothetical protein
MSGYLLKTLVTETRKSCFCAMLGVRISRQAFKPMHHHILYTHKTSEASFKTLEQDINNRYLISRFFPTCT